MIPFFGLQVNVMNRVITPGGILSLENPVHIRRPAPPASSWTPNEIALTTVWLDASDASTITVDGSNNVITWADKSSSAISYTQTNASIRPARLADAVEFDGATTGMDSTAPITIGTTPNISMFIVATPNLQGSGRFWQVGGGAGGSIAFVRTQNELSWRFNDGNAIAAGTSGEQLTTFVNASTTYGNSEIYTNGTLVAQSSSSNSTGTTNVQNGNSALGVGISSVETYKDFSPLSIKELVMMRSSNRGFIEQIEGYLAHKHGLEGDLRSDHPYKSSPPTT